MSLQEVMHSCYPFPPPTPPQKEDIFGSLVWGENGPCQATTTRSKDLGVFLGEQKGPCQATTTWRKRGFIVGEQKGPCQATSTRRNK